MLLLRACVRIYMCTCVYIYMCIYIYSVIFRYMCTYVDTCIYIYIYIYIWLRSYSRSQFFSCNCTYVYVYTVHVYTSLFEIHWYASFQSEVHTFAYLCSVFACVPVFVLMVMGYSDLCVYLYSYLHWYLQLFFHCLYFYLLVCLDLP